MRSKINNNLLRKVLCCVLVLAMLPLTALTAFADGEFTRELSVTGITVSVGGKTIENVYSDPVSY